MIKPGAFIQVFFCADSTHVRVTDRFWLWKVLLPRQCLSLRHVCVSYNGPFSTNTPNIFYFVSAGQKVPFEESERNKFSFENSGDAPTAVT